eukprot:EG_transcript_15670
MSTTVWVAQGNEDRKRKRELDEIEEQLLESERQHNAPKEQQFMEELKQMAAQSITEEDRERVLIDLRVEQEEILRRKILGLEDDADAGWDVDALKKQFESGGIRRQFPDGPLNFNFQLQDNNLEVEKLTVTAARVALPTSPEEEEQWAWKFTNSRGGVVLHHPSGELRCQGQWTQQLVLHCLLKKFTKRWHGWQGDKGVTDHDGDAKAYKDFFENGSIRRRFPRGPRDLKACLDFVVGDDTSTLTELPTKAKGCQVHLWRHKKMKGAIKLTTPSGEIVFQGNLRQQVGFLDLLKKITL